MLNKIYLAMLALAVLVTGFFVFYSYSWLQSIGSPAIAAENARYFSGIFWPVLVVSFIDLLVVANYLLWKNGRAWYLWAAFAYFAVFMLLQTLWLAPAIGAFEEANRLAENGFSLTPLVGVLNVLVVGIAVYCDQYIVNRFRGGRSGKETAPEK